MKLLDSQTGLAGSAERPLSLTANAIPTLRAKRDRIVSRIYRAFSGGTCFGVDLATLAAVRPDLYGALTSAESAIVGEYRALKSAGLLG